MNSLLDRTLPKQLYTAQTSGETSSLVFHTTSAKVHISSLYVLRHVGDRWKNYKTEVVLRIVSRSITPDYVKGYEASFSRP